MALKCRRKSRFSNKQARIQVGTVGNPLEFLSGALCTDESGFKKVVFIFDPGSRFIVEFNKKGVRLDEQTWAAQWWACGLPSVVCCLLGGFHVFRLIE